MNKSLVSMFALYFHFRDDASSFITKC